MNMATKALELIRRDCQTRGIELVMVSDIMLDSCPNVHFNDVKTFMDLCKRACKVLYCNAEILDDPDEGIRGEVENMVLFFMFNGVAHSIEFESEGVIEF